MKINKLLKYSIPILIILFCCFGYLFAPNDPNHVEVTCRLASSSIDYPLGTDSLGRCTLSRLLYGGKITVGIVILGSLLVSVLGTVIGLVISKDSKRQNILFESLLNAITAIPPIAYLIIFIAAWGNGIITMLVAITLSLFLRLVKLVKTRAEIEMKKAYVMCAITSGASRKRILFYHIFPNLIRDVFHFVCLSSADMILAIVGFSFIGLGLGDNVIDWGTMISDSHHLILSNPALTLYPVLFIFICTLSFNLLGRAIEKGGNYNVKNR